MAARTCRSACPALRQPAPPCPPACRASPCARRPGVLARREHEAQSCRLVDHICETYSVDLTPGEQLCVKDVIRGDREAAQARRTLWLGLGLGVALHLGLACSQLLLPAWWRVGGAAPAAGVNRAGASAGAGARTRLKLPRHACLLAGRVAAGHGLAV